jgi:hypothetical protein
MGVSRKTGNQVYDTAVNTAEGTRQAACAQGMTQAACITGEIAFYRACLTSAKVNGAGIEPIVNALRQLGTGGT